MTKISDDTPQPILSMLEEVAALLKELRDSPPRAAVVFASAIFEEGLWVEILNEFLRGQGRKEEYWDLEKKEQKQFEKAVPRTLAGKIDLACALGILTPDTLPDLKKARDIRNCVTHKGRALNPHDEEKAKAAAQYFVDMRAHLVKKRFSGIEFPELEL